MAISAAITGSLRLGPLRLRDDRFASAFTLDRRQSDELAALPLPDPPQLGEEAVLQGHFTEDGVEGAGGDLLDHRCTVDAADALDCLLEDLQAGVGVGAGPAVGRGADNVDVVVAVLLDEG